MINILWTLLSDTKRVITIVIALVVVSICCVLFYQHTRINSLKQEVQTITLQLQHERYMYEEERQKALLTITNQNSYIMQYKLSKEVYEKTITQKEKELQVNRFKQQEKINKELEKDSSADNQLQIIDTLLKDFANEKD